MPNMQNDQTQADKQKTAGAIDPNKKEMKKPDEAVDEKLAAGKGEPCTTGCSTKN